MRSCPIPVLLAALVLWSPTAPAWNDTGHMTVAELAWRSFSSRERRRISELLTHHPHYQTLIRVSIPTGADTNEWAFLKAATWPDMVRPARPGQPPKPPEVTRYHRAPWHYINLPYIAPADLGTINPTLHPPEPTNIVERLGALEATLRSKTAGPEERSIALCWILHLLGDIHQPLHTVAWFSQEFPGGDSGGNAVAVKPLSSPVKLHGYWDDVLGTGESPGFIRGLADRLGRDPRYKTSRLPELRANKTYASWAEESAAIAGPMAYLSGQIPHAKWRDGIPAVEVPPLDMTYRGQAESAAERRAALAGIRLGRLLSDIF